MDTAVIIREQMVNEYDQGYGNSYLIFAETYKDGMDALYKMFEGDEEYLEHLLYENHDVWNQFSYKIISSYDEDGNLNPDNAWYALLQAFASKEIGISALKRIAKQYPSWEHNRYEEVKPR